MNTPEQIIPGSVDERPAAVALALYEALDDLLDQVRHSPGGHLFLKGLAERALNAAREEGYDRHE